MKNNDFDILFEEVLNEFEKAVVKVKTSTHFEPCSGEEMVRKLEKDAHTAITDYQKCRIQPYKHAYRERTVEEYISSMKSQAMWTGTPGKLLECAFVSHKWGISQYRQGRKAEGRKHVLMALNLINMWNGACWALEMVEFKEESNKLKREAASLGGKRKSQKYRPVKDEVIRLLKKNKPEDGWKSKAAAINSLEEEISKFIELDFHKNSNWTSWDKLYRTISDWSRNDIELKNAFADVVKR